MDKVLADCDPKTALRLLGEGAALVDVRNPDEFAALHIAGAVCIPLPDLERRAAEIPTDRTIVLTCQSGAHGEMAADRLRAIGYQNIVNLAGGVDAWRGAGQDVRASKGVIPLERQVRGVAGVFVFGASLVAALGAQWAIAIPIFVGFMLALSAVTGLCPMMSLLRRMPWNRGVPGPATHSR